MKLEDIKLKDPAILIYASDFIMETSFMTMSEVGFFIKLLCLIHAHGHMSYERIHSICGDATKAVTELLTKDENGNYFHLRTEYESMKRASYKKSRAANLSGASKKPKKISAPVAPISSPGEINEKPLKRAYGKFNNVMLTDEEYALLKKEFGDGLYQKIKDLSLDIGSKGDRYESHYATILKWHNTLTERNKPKETDYSEFEEMVKAQEIFFLNRACKKDDS